MSLILIDGPPGSGKTTLGAALAAALSGYELLLEMDPNHPLHLAPVGEVVADFGELNNLDFAEIGNLIVDRWRSLAASLNSSSRSLILESYPYQSHVRVLMQMNAPNGLISEVLARINKVLAPHRPLLVMLRPPSAGQLSVVLERRGPEWERAMIEFMRETPYGSARGLAGRDGLLRFLDDYSLALVQWRSQWQQDAIDLEPWRVPTEEQVAQIVSFLKR